MKNSEIIRVAIAETSVIVRGGLTAALKRLPNLRIQPIEILSMGALSDCMNTQYPEMLIINPAFCGYFDIDKFRESYLGRRLYIIALVTSFVDASLLNKYDESISILDSLDILSAKLHTLMNMSEQDEDGESLSQREKEIIVCIVKGMTNKEIADQLGLSFHTIITHRRNLC